MDGYSQRVSMIRILISLGVGMILLFLVASHPAMTAALSSKNAIVIPADIYKDLALKSLPESTNLALNASPLTVTLPYSVYLPLIQKPLSGIYGYVTDNGVSAAGVQLTLVRSGYTLSTTVTQTDGSFEFASVPSLAAGQRYRVDYFGSDPNHLGLWNTRSITTYVAGSAVHIGDFDIANVELLTPTNGVSVTLPQTFQWTPRTGVPSDNYEFAMLQNSVYYYSSQLGFADSFELTALPAGFTIGQPCIWTVSISRPDGSGIAYEGRQITFTNSSMKRK